MRRIFAVLVTIFIWAAAAHATDVKVEAFMSVGLGEPPATSFNADKPVLHAIFKTKGAKNGDKIRGVWIADDVGDAAPKGYKIREETVTAEGDTNDGEFTLEKPDGWPQGAYHVEIYVNDDLAAKVNFIIKASSKSSKPTKSEGKETTND
jgi:hypothetical protein